MVRRRWATGILAAVLGLGAIGAAPAPAQAGGNWDLGIQILIGGNREPEHRRERVWIAPVYRTVYERVWVPPATQCVTEQVWIPQTVETREVVRHDRYGNRYIECVQVVVPGRYVSQTREVEVRPGYWDRVERQELVCEGRWELVDRYETPHRPLPPTVPHYRERDGQWDNHRDDHRRGDRYGRR